MTHVGIKPQEIQFNSTSSSVAGMGYPNLTEVLYSITNHNSAILRCTDIFLHYTKSPESSAY